jgi:cell division protein ZapE
MSLSEIYAELVTKNCLQEDQEQQAAIIALDQLSERLIKQSYRQNSPSKISTRLFAFNKPAEKQSVIPGIYFHGRVGRGKTMLMDIFYQQLNIQRKRRIHFHHFMESIHSALAELSGQENPLQCIAKAWANDFDLLCFDEFFVSDIGDAMLLAGLLNALLHQGIVLVATSNCAPEQLYRNGLQRERFLETIDVINRYCQVISIDGEVDHRIDISNNVTADDNFYRDYCFDKTNIEGFLKNHFKCLVKTEVSQYSFITVHHRSIPYIARTENTIWFDFMALCSGPRSQRDYISLANDFDVILLSDVPQFSGELIPAVFSGVEDRYQRSGVVMGELRALDDEARRFIALVDELYDRNVRLIISAEVDITQLYQGTQLTFEFARCQSRLHEMQRITYKTS